MKAAAATVVLSVMTLAGCVVASPDSDTYRDAAASTLGTAGSEVSTIQTMLSLLTKGRIGRPAVVTQLRYSEASLSKAAEGFESLNPPSSEQDLSDQTGQLLDEAETLLEDARLAVHRSETDTYPDIADDLSALASDFEDLEKSAS